METAPSPTAAALLAAAALAQAATADELEELAAAKAAELGAPTALELEALAAVAAGVAAKLELLDMARNEARFDWLTGTGNRRAFEEELSRELADPDREGDLSLVLFDIDDFKLVNDTYGHPAGDAALRGLARAVLRVARADDRLFRIGGDEFALIVHGDTRCAARIMRRVRSAGEDLRGIALTVSGGVASALAETDPATLVALADSLLLEAKRRGPGSLTQDVTPYRFPSLTRPVLPPLPSMLSLMKGRRHAVSGEATGVISIEAPDIVAAVRLAQRLTPIHCELFPSDGHRWRVQVIDVADADVKSMQDHVRDWLAVDGAAA
jgi:diguanylate cyclase (GGDEF)-like protein